MKLAFEPFDGRTCTDRDIGGMDSNSRIVGFITAGRQKHGIHISHFEGRCTSTVPRFEECRGFMKGVEKVLNHMAGLVSESTSGTKPQYCPEP